MVNMWLSALSETPDILMYTGVSIHPHLMSPHEQHSMPAMATLMPGKWRIEIAHPQIIRPDITMIIVRRPAATEQKPQVKCIVVMKESCGLQAGLTCMLATYSHNLHPHAILAVTDRLSS